MVKTGLHRLFASLTSRQLRIVGQILGGLLYLALPYYRFIARRNLRFVHPHWPVARVHRFTRKVFREFGITLIEALHTICSRPEQCLQRLDIEGAHHITEANQKGRGVIIISAHLGSWETALQLYPLCFERPLLCVHKVIGWERVDRLMIRSRTRFGNMLIPKKRAFGKMLKHLRQSGSVALMMDLSRQKQSVPVQFMGHRTSASLGAAMLAMRSGSPVIFVSCIRAPDGRLKMQVDPPITLQRTSDMRADLQQGTQLMTAVIERAVGRHPEQWFWMQKRWETYHAGLYTNAASLRRFSSKNKKK